MLLEPRAPWLALYTVPPSWMPVIQIVLLKDPRSQPLHSVDLYKAMNSFLEATSINLPWKENSRDIIWKMPQELGGIWNRSYCSLVLVSIFSVENVSKLL